MDPRTDAELARALRSGDAAAFEALYDRYHEWVAALAFRFTAHREEALDVLQETFTNLFRRGRDFELGSQMKTFLYPVVKHLSIARRQTVRWQAPPDPGMEPAAPLDRSGEVDGLRPGIAHRSTEVLRSFAPRGKPEDAGLGARPPILQPGTALDTEAYLLPAEATGR
jgi:RNA polymerase sigma factor (sigma-70 family)